MSLSQWKAYFSMVVLEQTNPITNPSSIHSPNSWYRHQSVPWYYIAIDWVCKTSYYWEIQYNKTLEELKNSIYTEDEYCRCCGEQSRDYYCRYCENDQCPGCGEMGCGSYMCHTCRHLDQYY